MTVDTSQPRSLNVPVKRPAVVMSGRHFRERVEIAIPACLLDTAGGHLTLHVELHPPDERTTAAWRLKGLENETA